LSWVRRCFGICYGFNNDCYFIVSNYINYNVGITDNNERIKLKRLIYNYNIKNQLTVVGTGVYDGAGVVNSLFSVCY
jgi:hypothetical protein